MKKTNNINISQFAKEFSGMLAGFESAVENISGVITGSFDTSRKESAAIAGLFAKSRSEAESIFSLFESLAGIFSGKGGFFESLFGLLPGGNLLGSVIGSLAPALPAGALSALGGPQQVHMPAPVV